MSETERLVYFNGHHDRMRGVQRIEAPVTLRKFWLDGWDEADGILYDRCKAGLYSIRGWVEARAA